MSIRGREPINKETAPVEGALQVYYHRNVILPLNVQSCFYNTGTLTQHSNLSHSSDPGSKLNIRWANRETGTEVSSCLCVLTVEVYIICVRVSVKSNPIITFAHICVFTFFRWRLCRKRRYHWLMNEYAFSPKGLFTGKFMKYVRNQHPFIIELMNSGTWAKLSRVTVTVKIIHD